MHRPHANKHWLYASRYRPEAGFTKISRSGPEHEVPNGGFSHDVELKSFGSSTNKTYIQFQPPSLVRYFTPRDDGTFSARSSSCLPLNVACVITYIMHHARQVPFVYRAGCMNLHCTPTGPNRSRVTYTMFSTNDNKFTR